MKSSIWSLFTNSISSALLSVLLLITAPTSHAQTDTLLHSFSNSPDGADPSALIHTAGRFYGTTSSGGTANLGTIFEVTQTGKERVIHSFSGPDGAIPIGGLINDKQRNLYGATAVGGAYNGGTVFVLSPSGTESVLYNFTGGNDGAGPEGPLVFDKAGNLYGATLAGGAHNQGIIFKLTLSGMETVLYSFTGGEDGSGPNGGLVVDSKGNLYGTTQAGGSGNFCGGYSCGVVFKVLPSGTETVLHSFNADGTDGFNPVSGLVRDKSGNLYGTTWVGGANDRGTVYEITPSGLETVLVYFGLGVNGYSPAAPLLLDKAGNLYGTTVYATNPTCSCGVVFKVAGFNEIVLYRFQNEYHPDGAFPYTGLTWGTKSQLYGTTSAGGVFNKGSVFELTP